MALFGKKQRLVPLEELTRTQVVLSSDNPDKVREIISIFVVPSIELLPRPEGLPEVDETGHTLTDNARLKSKAALDFVAKAAVSDDTGLEVAALDGRPGVRSARYAGDHASYDDNVKKLLEEMDGIEERGARFVTVSMLLYPDGTEVVAEGETLGHIATEPRGDNGWGYDFVFIPEDGDGRTFAEMSKDEKHQLSSRGKSFRALAKQIQVRDASVFKL